MSRSNPHDNGTPNPSKRWFEWNGEAGVVRYYDKEAKKNIEVGADFKFMLLDQLGSVRGWHELSQSGIYSNEVKDTRQDVLIVKAFKGGVLAEGIYKTIKDRVNSVGGQFVANCYIAFKNGGDGLAIGSMRFKGAALGAWMEFCKANRGELYKQAIAISGYTEGKKGRVVFRVPVLKVATLSDASNAKATALDVELQEFLAGYLQRNKRDQVEQPAHVTESTAVSDDGPSYEEPPYDDYEPAPITDDDIPFSWLLPLLLPLTALAGTVLA